MIVGSFALSVDRLIETKIWKERKQCHFHENLTRNGRINGRLSGAVTLANITGEGGAAMEEARECVVS